MKIGFIPIEGGHYYKEALEEVTRAEELGFDSVWMEDQCIVQIGRFVEQYGMTHLIRRTFPPGMPHTHIMRGLDLIAKEVMPAFR